MTGAAPQGFSQAPSLGHLEQSEPLLWAGFRHLYSSHKGTKRTHKYSVEKNPGGIFIYKHRILCTFLKDFFLFLHFYEREMLSDSPLKGCESASLQINFHLSAVSFISQLSFHGRLLTTVISTQPDIGVTHGRAMCQQGSLSKCLWKYFILRGGTNKRRV